MSVNTLSYYADYEQLVEQDLKELIECPLCDGIHENNTWCQFPDAA